MSKIKPLVREVRSNALWDGIKLVLWVMGGALMSTGALSALIRYLSTIPLDVWLIIGIFILSFIFIGSAAAIARRGKRAASSEGEAAPLEAAAEKSKEAVREAEDKFAWLREMADAQANEIDKYVRVERVLLCDLRLTDPIQIPYVTFWLDIINTSVYDITVHKNSIEGRISFRLNPLLEGTEIIYTEASIPASSRRNVNVKQRLNPTEVNLLKPYENDKEEALPLFHLDEIGITISGGTQFPQVKQKRLILPRDIGIKDSVYEDRVSTLEAEVSALQSELDKLKTYKLKFEIDVTRSKVCAGFAVDEGFDVSLHLYIRFINSDTYPLFMHTVSASLIRKNPDGTELEIPKIKYELYQAAYNPELESAWQLKSWQNIDLKIGERETTLYHTIKGHIDVSSDNRKLLFDSNCFLRVCMEAMNQPPYRLDFDIDWEGTGRGWADITPRT